MFEAQHIIMSVEQHPCIWDTNHEDYHNREIKDLVWEQICKEVYKDWETCTDKSSKCAELKKRWTNIRDYYRKKVQNPAGSAAKKSKTYVYSELLNFLAPVFTKRGSDGSYQEEEDSSSTREPNEERIVKQEAINHTETNATLSATSKKRKMDVPTQLLQQKQKPTAYTEEDDDTKYLLSFRSYMRTMSAHQKIDFKMGMLKLVKKVALENDQLPQHQYVNFYQRDNSSGSLQLDGNSWSPSPTFVSTFQVEKTSPVYLQSPSSSPPYHSFSQNTPGSSTSKPIKISPKRSPVYLQSPSPPTFPSSS